MVGAIDLAPTLLAVAGVSKPAEVEFDGECLPDVLLGRSDQSRNSPLCFRRPPDRPRHGTEGNLPDLAIREGAWKLLCEYDGAELQLFNLTIDPAETTNVATTNPEVAERLKTQLLDWHVSMPSDNGATYTAFSKRKGKKRTISPLLN